MSLHRYHANLWISIDMNTAVLSCEMVEPTVLMTPARKAPCSRPYRVARMVSEVFATLRSEEDGEFAIQDIGCHLNADRNLGKDGSGSDA
jgi:hypothetical protein